MRDAAAAAAPPSDRPMESTMNVCSVDFRAFMRGEWQLLGVTYLFYCPRSVNFFPLEFDHRR